MHLHRSFYFCLNYYILQYITISEIYLGSVFVLMPLAVGRLPAIGDFFRLLIIFSNNLDPAKDRHIIGPDLDPNCWTSDSVPYDF